MRDIQKISHKYYIGKASKVEIIYFRSAELDLTAVDVKSFGKTDVEQFFNGMFCKWKLYTAGLTILETVSHRDRFRTVCLVAVL